MEKSPEPFEKIRAIDGTDYELTRDNTRIYQHLGRLAVYDHIYITPEEMRPMYLWRYYPQNGKETQLFNFIKPKAIEDRCETFLNIKEVAESDIDAYIKHAVDDMGNCLPDWGSDTET